MTCSTEFSAGSASASETGAPAHTGGLFLGVDEAGYGPNLGPLLITISRWQTPGPPGDCDFYGLLQRAVTSSAPRDACSLQIVDSKKVLVGKSGWSSLETTALALMRCLGHEVTSFHQLRGLLSPQTGTCPDDCPLPPWYTGDLALPSSAHPDDVARRADQLLQQMQQCGIQLLDLRSEFVVEERFNRLLTRHETKGMTLSRLTFRLLRSVWEPQEPIPSLVICDKHGGRNRYDELLAEVLDDEMIFRLEEQRKLSRYRVGETELRFQVSGEQHLPVAASSILCKYLRELSMELFNRFWSDRCPDVRPTRGYPVDARRFRREIEAAWETLQLAETVLWRSR